MDEDYSRFGHLSRHTPPGFFTALNILLGEEAIAENLKRCRLIVKHLRGNRTNDFDWGFVCAELESWSLLLNTAVSLASHFADFSRRSEWFIELINDNFSP